MSQGEDAPLLSLPVFDDHILNTLEQVIHDADSDERPAFETFRSSFHPQTYPQAKKAAQKAGITLLVIE